MEKRNSPKFVLGFLILTLVLINPSIAFAQIAPEFETCVGDSGPEVHLITGIGGLTTLVPVIDTNANPPEIQLTETWTSSDTSYIVICGLDPSISYKVIKIITNNSGDAWENFDNELLDLALFDGNNPNGARLQANDIFNDLAVYPSYVTDLNPAGPPFFSTSNNGDGLDFEMGGAITRTSVTWATTVPDEQGFIDFLRFEGGTLFNGQTEAGMTYGLDNSNTEEQPFVLRQTPNIERDCEVLMDCPVGGELIPIDTTALLVAGAQMNAAWLIPLVLGTIGIGIVVARKLKL